MSDNNLPALVVGGHAALISTDELRSARDYAHAEKSDATRRAYASDWRHFESWCAARSADILPAAVETVAAYLAALADGGLKVSTINRRAAAITYAHRLRGVPPPTAAEPTKAVLRGIRRRVGVAVERKAPATGHAIARMIRRASVRDRAVLLLGFAAALRRSEIAALRVSDLERAPDGLIVHIRKSKTDQEGAGHTVAVPHGGKLRPVEAVDAWLGQSGRIGDDSLFDCCGRTVARIVKKHAGLAKLDPQEFSGHSLRAGFITSALESGADLLRVMDVTRHREVQTLKAYDRRAKQFKDHAGRKFL
jgi:site-specific recombinase XerD